MSATTVYKKLPNTKRGDTLSESRYKFTYQSTSEPVDLTDAEIISMFRYESKTGMISKNLSIDNGITVTNAENGEFTRDKMKMDVLVGKHYYDIQITFPDDDVKTYIEGDITIFQDVSYE